MNLIFYNFDVRRKLNLVTAVVSSNDIYIFKKESIMRFEGHSEISSHAS